jgi:hypothetical protein
MRVCCHRRFVSREQRGSPEIQSSNVDVSGLSDHALLSLPLHPTFGRQPAQKLLRRDRLGDGVYAAAPRSRSRRVWAIPVPQGVVRGRPEPGRWHRRAMATCCGAARRLRQPLRGYCRGLLTPQRRFQKQPPRPRPVASGRGSSAAMGTWKDTMHPRDATGTTETIRPDARSTKYLGAHAARDT